ncbi:NAD(P)H-binding protein [Humibacter soli]
MTPSIPDQGDSTPLEADSGTGLVLVTGGAGTLGSLVVELLRRHGHPVRVVSRRGTGPRDDVEYLKGDLDTGEGIQDAVAGVATVVHCAGSQKGDGDKARNLVAAARTAGVRHLVYISVAGADRIPVHSRADHAMFEYFAQKREGELAIESSGIPFTTLRATQFHTLAFVVAEAAAKLPVIPLPKRMRVQPVAAEEVAERLVALAEGEPAGYVPEFGGPEVHTSHELERAYLKRVGKRRWIVSIGLPGKGAKAVLSDAILSNGAERGVQTWEQYLQGRIGVANQ